MLAEKVLDERFTAASGAWALFPDPSGNLHRFVAGVDEPCALLDVITPPYSPASEAHAQQRFAYYQEFPYELHTNQSTITRVRIYTDSEY
jgi:cysteamine dioxygenase